MSQRTHQRHVLVIEAAADGTVHLSKTLSVPVVRRQDAPTCFDMNASIYVWSTDRFRDSAAVLQPGTRLHEMPEDRSVDIDSELDFQIVDMLMRQRAQTAGGA